MQSMILQPRFSETFKRNDRYITAFYSTKIFRLSLLYIIDYLHLRLLRPKNLIIFTHVHFNFSICLSMYPSTDTHSHIHTYKYINDCSTLQNECKNI